ncbi:MAG: hypothetical protein J5674_01725 [Candidatus Methanomethylophilaceae archaeon]|nr:hypothetical protein [Candidatus Methanomethylophilaceae archaeon]
MGPYFPTSIAESRMWPCIAKNSSFNGNPFSRPSSQSRAYTVSVYLWTLSGGAMPPYPVPLSMGHLSRTPHQLLRPSVKSLLLRDSPSSTSVFLRSARIQWIQSNPQTGMAS